MNREIIDALHAAGALSDLDRGFARLMARLSGPGDGALGLAAALQAQDGIYADFQTSMGSYTCKLYYVEAQAVANFIGLATGQRAWLDLPTGRWRTNAFYDGIIFHRVIVDFMNQAGSPKHQAIGINTHESMIKGRE